MNMDLLHNCLLKIVIKSKYNLPHLKVKGALTFCVKVTGNVSSSLSNFCYSSLNIGETLKQLRFSVAAELLCKLTKQIC